MKNRIIAMNLIAVLLLVSSSCSNFLNEGPQTALTQEQVFSDLNNIDPLVLGLYTSWRNTKKDRGGFVFSLGTDESQQGAYQVRTESGQAGLDRYDGFLAPSNTALQAQWDSRWPVISSAANTIYALKSNNQDPARKNELMGEASFIRGALEFEISQYWGSIPIIDLDKLSEFGTARQPLSLVYTYIVNDLEAAITYLPETQSDTRRATKWAAHALLGKVYMYAPVEAGIRDFAKAQEHFLAVINSGKFSLEATYSDLWSTSNTNSSEGIFSFQFNNIYPDNNQIQWQMGSRSLANLSQYCYFGGYDLMVPTIYAYSDVTDGGVWETGDLRKAESVRYDFEYQNQTPVLEASFGGDELDPHVKKFEDIRVDGVASFWYSGKNVYFLRLADIILCYAETLNETGATAQGVTEVNKIRARAFGGSLPAGMEWSNGMSQDEFRTKILDERMRELCFEGWRRMDLNRYGKLVELVSARNKWTAESGTIQVFHNLYPIPLTEIQQNDDIDVDDQNPGYANQ